MKVVQFEIPVAQAESVTVSEDVLPFFYGHLHRHREMQLTLILKGEGTLLVGNCIKSFKAGDIYVIGANQPHILKSDESHRIDAGLCNVHAIHIFFDYEKTLQNLMLFPEMEFVTKFIKSATQGVQVPGEHAQEASDLFFRINRASGFKRLLLFIKLIRHLSKNLNNYNLLTTGVAHPSLPEQEDNRMGKIFQFTAEHYAENITIERIASVVHITPQAFCKYFKKHTLKTYNKFLNEYRVNEACKKIINGDFECISSIAYATGFNSPINFNKVFKKTTGKSPSEYSKEYRQEWNKAVNMLREPA
ncbi:AraC family transcriptional regulator [Pontibacter roseus]|uniref:AraC family transcriptional regulator n=1 Tax=Pontibacter roseus TaxID=336989 RepID=UPI000379E075|nr:AraC family transcriptional regulator [Pontibacter roseus]